MDKVIVINLSLQNSNGNAIMPIKLPTARSAVPTASAPMTKSVTTGIIPKNGVRR